MLVLQKCYPTFPRLAIYDIDYVKLMHLLSPSKQKVCAMEMKNVWFANIKNYTFSETDPDKKNRAATVIISTVTHDIFMALLI